MRRALRPDPNPAIQFASGSRFASKHESRFLENLVRTGMKKLLLETLLGLC